MYRLQKEKNINMLYNTLLALGVMLACLHLAFELFDMVLSIVYYDKFNVSSITYVVCQLLTIYVPFMLIIPNGNSPKAIKLKWVLYAIAICYIIGNCWIVYYIVMNSFADFFSSGFSEFYAFQRENALMFNYINWGCYEPIGVLFSCIAALLHFICARTLRKGRKTFRTMLILILALTTGIPSFYKLFAYSHLSINMEFTLIKNMFLIASQALCYGALISLSLSHRLWQQTLWTVARKSQYRR